MANRLDERRSSTYVREANLPFNFCKTVHVMKPDRTPWIQRSKPYKFDLSMIFLTSSRIEGNSLPNPALETEEKD